MPRLLRRVAAASAVVLGVVGLAVPSAGAATDPLAGLRAHIAADLRASTAAHAAVRADVAGVGRMGVASTALLPPASNQKIFTTATVLLRHGGDFRYVNRLMTDAPVRSDGVLLGDLVVIGSGDPTLTSARLDGLAVSLRKAGIWHVHGGLYVDDSRYGHDTWAPGWKASFVPGETSAISAFTVDRNRGFSGNPTPANTQLFRRILARRGIGVAGANCAGRPAAPLTDQLATDASPPLSAIVRHTLKYSDNFYAEMLLREAGAAATGHGTRASGIAAVGAAARRLNVPLGGVYDGSGLSYLNREAPTQLVSWLAALAGTDIADDLMTAMPRSCIDGTLSNRLCGPWLTGRVRAKTGTLNGVTTLSGYTRTASGRTVVFSVMLSGVRNMTTARHQMDAAVARLARYTG